MCVCVCRGCLINKQIMHNETLALSSAERKQRLKMQINKRNRIRSYARTTARYTTLVEQRLGENVVVVAFFAFRRMNVRTPPGTAADWPLAFEMSAAPGAREQLLPLRPWLSAALLHCSHCVRRGWLIMVAQCGDKFLENRIDAPTLPYGLLQMFTYPAGE